MKIKVGDKVRHSVFSGKEFTGVIESIQICPAGSKTGKSVFSCDLKEHHVVCDLDNGHWCYGNQILEVLGNGKRD